MQYSQLHWDGYISGGAGEIRKEHYTYTDRKKVEKLIDLGFLSSLRIEMDPVTANVYAACNSSLHDLFQK